MDPVQELCQLSRDETARATQRYRGWGRKEKKRGETHNNKSHKGNPSPLFEHTLPSSHPRFNSPDSTAPGVSVFRLYHPPLAIRRPPRPSLKYVVTCPETCSISSLVKCGTSTSEEYSGKRAPAKIGDTSKLTLESLARKMVACHGGDYAEEEVAGERELGGDDVPWRAYPGDCLKAEHLTTT